MIRYKLFLVLNFFISKMMFGWFICFSIVILFFMMCFWNYVVKSMSVIENISILF